MIYIKKEHFKLLFDNNIIIDCGIIDASTFLFSLENKDDFKQYEDLESIYINKYIIFYRISDSQNKYGYAHMKNYLTLYCAGSSYNSNTEGLFIDEEGSVCVLNENGFSNEKNIQEQWTNEQKNNVCVFRLKNIKGIIYGCGANKLAFRRTNNKINQYIGAIDTHTDYEKKGLNGAFIDIDGFSHDDIYAVGGYGMVWHYNGEKWDIIAFPSNDIVTTVCCGKDEYVYIGCKKGTIFKGRNHTWEKIHAGSLLLTYKDIVWHADTLWCTNDYGIWTLKENEIIPADVSDEIKACSGNLAVGYGTMLLAGINGAAYHDGKEWHVLFQENAFPENDNV